MIKFAAYVVAFAAGLALFASPAFAGPISPGFEQGPNVPLTSFSPTDANGLGWFASNTDGERIQSTVPKPAAAGNYYASLLQNANAYNGQALGIGNFGFTGFDRIYATFAVTANTTYDVSFQHASDNRFGYGAGISVVEMVDVNSNGTLAQQFFGTPGLFQWKTETFQFTTGGATTSAAIAFTVMGGANSSAVFDDIVINPAVPEPSTIALFLCAGAGLFFTRRRSR